jgi:hypothetical protein
VAFSHAPDYDPSFAGETWVVDLRSNQPKQVLMGSCSTYGSTMRFLDSGELAYCCGEELVVQAIGGKARTVGQCAKGPVDRTLIVGEYR